MPRPPVLFLLLMACAIPGGALAQQDSQPAHLVTIRGTVRDTLSGDPVRHAVVRVLPAGTSTLSDDDGRYAVVAPTGQRRLEARAIGFRPTTIVVTVGDSSLRQDVYLQHFPVELAPIIASEQDDAARRIIRAAIARKHQLFGALHYYRYAAYVKFVVRDLSKPQDSASAIQFITETRTAAYW